MAILKSKKTSFDELQSKTIDRIVNFNKKKSDANFAVSEFQVELTEINNQIAQKKAEYKDTLDSQLLRDIATLDDKKASVQRLMEIQRQAFGNGNTKYEMTDSDRKDLTSTFAPYRKQEHELTEKLNKQIAELEKTLEALHDVRSEYWNDFYAPIYGLALQVTGDQFAVHFLRANQPLGEASQKLLTLAHHKAFPQSYMD
ncbi:hypothetical protein [Paenibacillus sp. Soil787]|uniref:hypothetical protein n=1 Tax=Paenibacillus sp. Soil787 TaxID=1736411 RepID=UPI000702B2D7|nr:hypothetical protein [Paenibacillus sp. Soil787]KRF10756.1 hypothetical protein ASG93_17650 [Paenibacillus sp. Soil787]